MFLCGLILLLARLARPNENLYVDLEPGHAKQDYDSMEEVRGHENETETEKPAEDELLIREAILDVAYYLRRFKFSGHDPRSDGTEQHCEQNLYVEFPSPPLRNIHWEVKKNCEPSFVDCVKYLQQQVSQTVLPRRWDSLTITRQNGWSFITDRDLIKAADDQCVKRLMRDDEAYEVFSGPLQKFQWLTSASYYMCFYTMKEISYLKTFMEECDNYAACIHWGLGFNNKDVRGDNGQPFACAFYSFCPDPCCPLKYLPDWSSCGDYSPCGKSSNDKSSICSFSRKSNVHFDALMQNHWNISCKCDEPGTRWDSKSGMCADIDECVEMETPCNYPSETCRNLPGTYSCICNPLGYTLNRKSHTCEKDPFLYRIFYPPLPRYEDESKSLPEIFSDRFHLFIQKIKFLILEYLEKQKEKKVNRTKT